MRSFLPLLLVLGLTALPSGAETAHREWLTSVDEALAQAGKTDQRILVDLYADWCGWCKRLEEDVFSTATFQEFAQDLVLLRVDTEDGAEGSRLQERFEAFSLPTTLVLDRNLAMVAKVEGYAEAPQYVAIMQREVSTFDELIRGYERFGQSDDLRVLGILADEFHLRNDGDRAAELYRRMISTDQLQPAKAVRIHYQLTDALRLAAQYEEAFEELNAARQLALQIGDTPIVQRLELLGAQISLDSGDCDRARDALESFMGTYPTSDLVKVARRTLQTISTQRYQCT